MECRRQRSSRLAVPPLCRGSCAGMADSTPWSPMSLLTPRRGESRTMGSRPSTPRNGSVSRPCTPRFTDLCDSTHSLSRAGTPRNLSEVAHGHSRPGSMKTLSVMCGPGASPHTDHKLKLGLVLVWQRAFRVEQARQAVRRAGWDFAAAAIQRQVRLWLQHRKVTCRALQASRELKGHLEAMRCRLRFAEFRETHEIYLASHKVLGTARSLNRRLPCRRPSTGLGVASQEPHQQTRSSDRTPSAASGARTSRSQARASRRVPSNCGASTPRASFCDVTFELRASTAWASTAEALRRSGGAVGSPGRGKPQRVSVRTQSRVSRRPARTGSSAAMPHDRSPTVEGRVPLLQGMPTPGGERGSPAVDGGGTEQQPPLQGMSTLVFDGGDAPESLLPASVVLAAQSPPEQLKTMLLQARQRARTMYKEAADAIAADGSPEAKISDEGDPGMSPLGNTPLTSMGGSYASGSASFCSPWNGEQHSAVVQFGCDLQAPHPAASPAQTNANFHADPAGSATCTATCASPVSTHGGRSFSSTDPGAPQCVDRQSTQKEQVQQPWSPRSTLTPRMSGIPDAAASGGGVRNERAQSHSPPPCRPIRFASLTSPRGGHGGASTPRLCSRLGSAGRASIASCELEELDAQSTGVARAALGRRVSLRSLSCTMPSPMPGPDLRAADARLIRSPCALIGNSHRDTAEFICHGLAQDALVKGRSTPRLPGPLSPRVMPLTPRR